MNGPDDARADAERIGAGAIGALPSPGPLAGADRNAISTSMTLSDPPGGANAAPSPSPADGPVVRLMQRRRSPVARMVRVCIGLLVLLVGIVTAPTPIPIGVILIAIGLYMLARESLTARAAIRWARRRLPSLDRGLCHVAPRLPRAIRVIIRRTAPVTSRRQIGPDESPARGPTPPDAA